MTPAIAVVPHRIPTATPAAHGRQHGRDRAPRPVGIRRGVTRNWPQMQPAAAAHGHSAAHHRRPRLPGMPRRPAVAISTHSCRQRLPGTKKHVPRCRAGAGMPHTHLHQAVSAAVGRSRSGAQLRRKHVGSEIGLHQGPGRGHVRALHRRGVGIGQWGRRVASVDMSRRHGGGRGRPLVPALALARHRPRVQIVRGLRDLALRQPLRVHGPGLGRARDDRHSPGGVINPAHRQHSEVTGTVVGPGVRVSVAACVGRQAMQLHMSATVNVTMLLPGQSLPRRSHRKI